MSRIYDDKTLTRVCVRLWADDYEYLRRMSQSRGSLGLNLLIRQVVHSYVAHTNDQENQQLNKLPDGALDDLEIEIDLTGLEFEPEPEKAEAVDITLEQEATQWQSQSSSRPEATRHRRTSK